MKPAIWLVTVMIILVMAPAAHSADWIVDKSVPCEQVGFCDVNLEVVNDRGIPQRAFLYLADENWNPILVNQEVNNFEIAPFRYQVERGKASLNFTPESFRRKVVYEQWNGNYNETVVSISKETYLKPFPSPLGEGVSMIEGFREVKPGTRVLVTRNRLTVFDGVISDSDGKPLDYSKATDLYPEKQGVRYVIPEAGNHQVILPSFDLPVTNPKLDRGERALLGLINDERAKLGRPLLQEAAALSAAADGYACWISMHRDFKGSAHDAYGSPQRRAIDFGWPDPSRYVRNGNVGENLVSFPRVIDGFRWWMQSPGHRRAMLNEEYVYAGVGTACGQTSLKLSTVIPLEMSDAPWGGISGDTGDSSLADGLGGGGSPGVRRVKFRPRVTLLKKRARRPVLRVRVNGARPAGRLVVRAGKIKKAVNKRAVRLKVRKSGRIIIRFTALKNSKTKTGKIVFQLKTRKKVTRLKRI